MIRSVAATGGLLACIGALVLGGIGLFLMTLGVCIMLAALPIWPEGE